MDIYSVTGEKKPLFTVLFNHGDSLVRLIFLVISFIKGKSRFS